MEIVYHILCFLEQVKLNNSNQILYLLIVVYYENNLSPAQTTGNQNTTVFPI